MLPALCRSVCGAARLGLGLRSAPLLLLPRPLASGLSPGLRCLWSLCGPGQAHTHRPRLLSSARPLNSVSCGCGGLHTEGDKAFAEYLTDEIKEEKKIQKTAVLPKLSGGWDMELNGTEAKLVRKMEGEKITVSFNTNNSIPPTLEEEQQQQEGQKSDENEPEIVSTPNFVVEVTKLSGSQNLVFDCHYPESEVAHGEEDDSDIFTIREVSFQPMGDTDWKETSYTLNTDSLDWALYDHLMDFLADRGIDNTFADELMELSTALEHQEYIRFLEELKGFIKC
ncbi:complement component 1 Q subcomponent-binding protein, mitochondrial [Callorhinchus milii]|uniref:Complement component 1 Q subcomponent-binding protein, mitochondrial n=1 Tax=Callorhinchus milii TaxID=7868 RepID=A0A4W3IBB9_CALMI|nr:complement component 1 Q subcomponent-binding protein, mitochondrial [Callorhinchus milii]|eukprot:gi/632984783/ref/XP_007909315.1/ PREDICTED: complement component 1 Q subcomponent-binding protein, mitochondrial [Callorhinchus milii]